MAQLASRQQLRASFLRIAIVTVPAVLLLGSFSAMVGGGAENPWFDGLAKPSFQPPDWAFPVAWTALYVMMALALAMIIHARGARGRGVAITAFVVQLALNLAWSPLFFAAHRITPAFWLIVAIFVLAAVTALLFHRIRTVAGWLMAPYLIWLLFAAVLNWQISVLNPNGEAATSGDEVEMTLPAR